MNKTKTKIAILGIAVLFAVLSVSAASAHVTAYFTPAECSVPEGECHSAYVEVWMDVTDPHQVKGGQFAIHYDPSCVNITEHPVALTPDRWGPCIDSSVSSWNVYPECWGPGYDMIMYTFAFAVPHAYCPSPQMIANFTVHCNSSEYCASNLSVSCGEYCWACPIEVMDPTGVHLYPDHVTLVDGTFECGEAPTTYTISGYTTPAADTVNITNLNNSKEWAASIYGNFYNLTLNVGEDVNATEILQIVACDELGNHESNCNATTHVPENIPGEDTNVNLTLDHYCLNWMTYPYKTWEQSNWSGPAVMEMMIDHYRPPGFMPSQTWLNATGIAHNQGCNADLQYVDPRGMQRTLNEVLHNTTNGGRYANYGIGNYDTVERALWYICYWQYAGPGAAPTYGDYSNWMAIRGIHTSENPKRKALGTYDIYGFWINDPNPTTGGIGENTYKSVDQWTSTYHLSLTDVRGGDSYLNRYVAVCEPPEQDPGEVRLVHSKARFSGTITAEATDEELTVDVGGVPLNQLICNRKLAREKENKVVQAAIEGVNEQLAPFDRGFKKTFAGTVAGKPMPVKSDAGDYYLVPFGIESDGNSVLAVVIVDSDGGKFKEASWVNEPVKYLSVTPQEALKIVYKEMKGKSTIKVLKKDKATGKLRKADVIDQNVDTVGDITLDETERQRRTAYLELVYKGESPYYPVWKITIGDSIFFVDQSGTLTTGITTSTPMPKSMEPVLQIVE